mmetsp:Transcript_58562/g.68395  ORF Transcript_58562/g.68395 Transcript_58562/m.68395 type:complete len:293 (+) Transcript_58562:491-1369(+)
MQVRHGLERKLAFHPNIKCFSYKNLRRSLDQLIRRPLGAGNLPLLASLRLLILLQKRRHGLPRILRNHHQRRRTLLVVIGIPKRHGFPHLPGSTRSSDPMHVRFHIASHVEVDHVRDTLDIQSSRRHVRRHHYLALFRHEFFQGCVAFVLRLVSVHRHGREPFLPETACDDIHPTFGIGEYHHRCILFQSTQQVVQLFILLVILRFDEGLSDGLVGREFPVLCTNLPDKDFHGVTRAQKILRHAAHRLGPRCREEQRLTNFRKLLHHGVELLFKPHVQHPIGFVQYGERTMG